MPTEGGLIQPGSTFDPMTSTDSLPVTSTYVYTVENDNGCIDSSVLTITIVDDASVEGHEFNRIVIYPNPTKGLLFVSTTDQSALLTEVVIYNLVGEIVSNHKVINGEKLVKIDMTAHANGVYFIKACGHGSVLVTERLVLQH